MLVLLPRVIIMLAAVAFVYRCIYRLSSQNLCQLTSITGLILYLVSSKEVGRSFLVGSHGTRLDSHCIWPCGHDGTPLFFYLHRTFHCSGEEAMKAKNVFYYLTYTGAVDLDSVTDPQMRKVIFTMHINYQALLVLVVSSELIPIVISLRLLGSGRSDAAFWTDPLSALPRATPS